MGFFFKRKSAAENQTAESHSSQYHEDKSKEEVYRILNSSYFYPLEKNDSYVLGTFPSPEEPVFSIIAYFKENQCFIKKSWPHIPGHSIGCSKHCVSPNNWIAFTIDIRKTLIRRKISICVIQLAKKNGKYTMRRTEHGIISILHPVDTLLY